MGSLDNFKNNCRWKTSWDIGIYDYVRGNILKYLCASPGLEFEPDTLHSIVIYSYRLLAFNFRFFSVEVGYNLWCVNFCF